MEKKIKKYLLFIDVDGTLVSVGTQKIDERIPKLFDRIQKDGHVVAVVSGRSQKSILSIDGTNHARYMCGLMGCTAIDMQTNKKIIEPIPMDKDTLKGLIEDINSLGLNWVYKNDTMEKSYFNDPDLINKYLPKNVEKEEFLKDMENLKVYQILVNGNIPENIIKKYSLLQKKKQKNIQKKINSIWNFLPSVTLRKCSNSGTKSKPTSKRKSNTCTAYRTHMQS